MFPFVSYETFLQEYQQKEALHLEKSPPAAKALLAAKLQETSDVVVITSGQNEEDFLQNLSALLKEEPLHLPAWETLIGEDISPSPDIIGKRMHTLYELLHKKKKKVVVTGLLSCLQSLPSLQKSDFTTWKKGAKVLWEKAPSYLEKLGYEKVALVSDKNQFAVRNGIIDVFPVSSTDPYRIEFFGDTIDTIRIFDLIEQKSIEKKEAVFFAPASERLFLKQGKKALWDYLEKPTVFLFDDLEALEDQYVSLLNLPAFSSPFMQNIQEFFTAIAPHKKLYFTKQPLADLTEVKIEKTGSDLSVFSMFEVELKAKTLAQEFYPVGVDLLQEKELFSLYFLYEKKEDQLFFSQSLDDFPKNATFLQSALSSGFCYKNHLVFSKQDITQKKRVSRQKWRSAYHGNLSDFHSFSPGEYVVHFHSGIGKYLGIEKQKNHLGVQEEFLLIEYAKKSTLYVPASQSHLLSRYIGSSEKSPTLTELGSKKWQQIKVKAQKDIIGYASDLLHLYAERQLDLAPKHSLDSSLMKEFEEDFPYQETPDQLLAISSIKEDLQGSKPMDRLVSGDVGYGKTEVAMRAAFKSVVDGGGQVALLVPTTVLAMQHFDTFSERMKGYPVEVRVLSRFQKAKENKKTLEDLQKGNVDILIGTHRILSKDVNFSKLTLMIIDEEQRFGVRAKEALKKRKKSVHALSLSATPIPRTLYMSLIGARDVSVMATPPQDRLPIKTILAENEDELIKNAIFREMARKGQTFFIHNRVESIHQRAKHIQKLVPAAKIAVAHGQMSAEEVDLIFQSFRNGEVDVLFATVIVENGIDVPNANTILIDRADCYGVSDLYQLRGRVGRWKRSAYAYFLLPKNRSIKETSQKRLQALLETSGYGGGMKLAMRDLELRGAGDILGVQQSGQVAAIGFHLYCKLLKRVLSALKEKKPVLFTETKIECFFPASLPEMYISSNQIRMELYHRLGEMQSNAEVDLLEKELIDRFGPYPNEVEWLLYLTKVRIFASFNQFTKLRFLQKELFAERTLGKKVFSQRIFLPKHLNTPQALMNHVLQKLQEEFLDKRIASFRKIS